MTIKIHYENVINIMYLNKGYGIINIENKQKGGCQMDNAAANEVRRQYYRDYASTHRDSIKAAQKRWRKANPDKIREYNARYWNRRAQEVKEGETSGKNNSRST